MCKPIGTRLPELQPGDPSYPPGKAIAIISAEQAATSLQVARRLNGKVEALATLIELGVDVNAYNTRVQYHATPLHNAVCSGSLEAVRMLVETGARVDAKDTAYQATPLTWAEYYLREGKSPKQYAAIVACLREKGGEG